MTYRHRSGTPIETDATVLKIDESKEKIRHLERTGNSFTYELGKKDVVYGLGENVRGINKRGYIYVSFCSDEFNHDEETRSLYGAHNFIIISGREKFGIFVDCPSKVTFDIGFTNLDELKITVENDGFDLYVIEERNLEEIVREFRKLTGKNYIPPKWAFGIGQSRWGYAGEDDAEQVRAGYRSNNIPIDCIYLDIDYMEHFKNFTANSEKIKNFTKFVKRMKDDDIHIVPIIDAGVKVEDGYETYDEGKANGYFCKDEDGKDFVVGVWPGKCCLPDFLNSKVRKWFGRKYKILTDAGIDGFWNDMNEPALFWSEKNYWKTVERISAMKGTDINSHGNFTLKELGQKLPNNMIDYKSFYHDVDGKKIRHDLVHNLFGFNMTKSPAEFFEEEFPDTRKLLFSRASCIGMHRYSGIWMGDNKSRWQHLLMNMKMLTSLSMCGFLYTGADIGGFGCDTTEDLLLRWYALGIFNPLLRNHTSLSTRDQEPYRFKNSIKAFSSILHLRYMLLPYIYSEFMKASINDTMYAFPLGFMFPDDEDAIRCEDQIFIGKNIMIAPVYEQNATGRHVCIPESMKLLRFRDCNIIEEKIYEKGHHYIYVELDEVCIFLKKGCLLPLAKKVDRMRDIDYESLMLISNEGTSYELYNDDGESKKTNARIQVLSL